MKRITMCMLLILAVITGAVVAPIPVMGDEILPVKMVDLEYTRDVFISDVSELEDSPVKLLLNSGNNTGLYETGLPNLKNIQSFSNGILTYDNVSYKFGPLGSPGNRNEAANAVHAADGNPIVIDIPNGLYSSIRFIATSTSGSPASATVTVSYLNESVPVVSGVTRIGSYRASDADAGNVVENEYYLGAAGAVRPGGSYRGQLYAYYIITNPGKIVDKITISCNTAVIFAVSAVGISKEQLSGGIQNLIQGLSIPPTQENREMVSTILEMIEMGKEMGMSDEEINNIEGMDKFLEIDRHLIRIKDHRVFIDLDNMNVDVNFSGPIDSSTVNKTNIRVLKNGVAIAPEKYSLATVGEQDIRVIINNELDYDSNYSVEFSKDVASGIGNKLTLGSVHTITFIPEAPFEVTEFELKDENGNSTTVVESGGKTVTAFVKVKNNTLPANVDYVVTIALFSPSGRMMDKIVASGSVAEGETSDEITGEIFIPEDVSSGYKMECFVWNSYSDMKLLYNTLTK